MKCAQLFSYLRFVHVTPLHAKWLAKQRRKQAERCRELKVLLCSLRFEWKTFSPVATSEQKSP